MEPRFYKRFKKIDPEDLFEKLIKKSTKKMLSLAPPEFKKNDFHCTVFSKHDFAVSPTPSEEPHLGTSFWTYSGA